MAARPKEHCPQTLGPRAHISGAAAELLAILSQHQAKADMVDAHGAALRQVPRLLGRSKDLRR